MANRIRGVFPFEAGGESYVMQYTANGMCALEDTTGQTATAFLQGLDAAGENLSFRDARLLFWAGLQEHHEGLTLHQAGKIMTALGGIVPAMEMTAQAVQASMPEAKTADGAAGNGKAAS
ncbi:hypothetical protein KUV73_24005 [Mameliella alba]|nr:hypothetical protein [Mameliella alba]MBY6172440.1 hypothetical protein [Mameliella alba]MBY6177454.1 hypothetical protein [Mameliella alba]